MMVFADCSPPPSCCVPSPRSSSGESAGSLGCCQVISPTVRRVLIGWMHDACDGIGLDSHALQHAVTYLDSFLVFHPVENDELQCLASSCVLLAAKLLAAGKFQAEKANAVVCGSSAERRHIVQMEKRVLSAMSYRMLQVTLLEECETVLSTLSHECGLPLRWTETTEAQLVLELLNDAVIYDHTLSNLPAPVLAIAISRIFLRDLPSAMGFDAVTCADFLDVLRECDAALTRLHSTGTEVFESMINESILQLRDLGDDIFLRRHRRALYYKRHSLPAYNFNGLNKSSRYSLPNPL